MDHNEKSAVIPRPLVRANQVVIILSVVLSWLLYFPLLLLIPFLSGLGGILFDFNPIMKGAAKFLRKPHSQYIPEDKEQQKFNQIIALICLGGALIFSLLNLNIGFYILTTIVAAAATIALLGFCIGCFIHYQWKQYQYRRRKAI
ncbi:DUF4395 domain-containing protein [Bacillaceae bacterium Marseille-Q3522]|nr:DUF4395 domain-containing protein [Bacillaceae bacterium Marseille-Q3522]